MPTNKDAVYFYDRGKAKMAAEKYKAAIAKFTKAIKLDAKNAHYFYCRAEAESKLTQYQTDAILDYSQAIELKPEMADYYAARAETENHLAQYEAAKLDYTKAIELNKNQGIYFWQRALVEYQLKNYEAAGNDFWAAQELNYPRQSLKQFFHHSLSQLEGAYFYKLGNDSYRLKQYETAIKHYSTALRYEAELRHENAVYEAAYDQTEIALMQQRQAMDGNKKDDAIMILEQSAVVVTEPIKVEEKSFTSKTELTITTPKLDIPNKVTSDMRSLKTQADSLYAEAKTHCEDGKLSEAKIAYRKAQDVYKELRSLGVECQKRLNKIKTKLAELKQPQASSSNVALTLPLPQPLLQKKTSIAGLADLATTLPAAAPKKFNPPTANVKGGFFKQPAAVFSSTPQASSSQMSSVNGLGSLLQMQPSGRNSINLG